MKYRSAAALARRAEKRKLLGITDDGQGSGEGSGAAPTTGAAPSKPSKPSKSAATPSKSWKCPKCSNDNFMSRARCYNKACKEPRPSHIVVPSPSPAPKAGGTAVGGATPQGARATGAHRPNATAHTPNTPGDQQEPGQDAALQEQGAWTCPGCNNQNYASRSVCHSKTCNERRPAASSAGTPSSSWPGSFARRPTVVSHAKRLPKMAWPSQAG